ncbi:hypothetical protein NLU13_5083 [Sarocladium strictum]|uniref:Glucose-methanol-choline oxidoreductase N-terminal domain-containing protein n=1 Tax=Sarocladium strictum TaxID=5046 RepID=A0AA39GK37_SARSR|nr:hypothetical protein NLU13_5083 [Sarocladium strictum]
MWPRLQCIVRTSNIHHPDLASKSVPRKGTTQNHTKDMDSKFDFIVVGAGPAGCALAARLCSSTSSPSVLLLEAGGDNEGVDLRVDGERWLTFKNEHMNWGYKTTPQKECLDREMDYSRGLGLGGSSAINFGVYTLGARDEYNEWARLVDDESYSWTSMQQRFKSLEAFDPSLPPGATDRYAAPDPSNHGNAGSLKVGYAPEWERDLEPMLDVISEAGFPANPDHNSGNPIGMSVLINSAQQGLRSTAKDLITPRPDNLTVRTRARVQKLALEGKRVVGVVCEDSTYYASREVILSAGSLDSPRILMHSGIGDSEELAKFDIPTTANLAGVGKGLRDHAFCSVVHTRRPGSTDRPGFYGNTRAMEEAKRQWEVDRKGPWSKFGCEMGIGWFKLDNLSSTPEFQASPQPTQDLLLQETVPHYELLTHFPVHWLIPNFPEPHPDYSCLLVFLSQAESRGRVSLQSPDPNVPLLFDPRFLESPLDRRIAIESLREVLLRLVKSDGYSREVVTQLAGPASESDDDLLRYWRQTAASSWHMTGTLRMGRPEDGDAVVDRSFRVMGGITGLRVADMSVAPVLSSAHTQATAYVTGLTCAEKLVEEYGL